MNYLTFGIRLYNNNYKIDRLLNKQGETKQRNVIYNKDDKQRIDTYSWYGMSIHDKWRVDSSIVTTDDSEKLDYKKEELTFYENY